MSNFNIDDYIKEMVLSSELEEKARQCKTSRELMELAAEEDIELPDAALESVAGGCGGDQKNYYHIGCGGTVRSLGDDGYLCQKCGQQLSFHEIEVR